MIRAIAIVMFAIVPFTSACNRVFGLASTDLIPPIDGPGPDAPAACPEIGQPLRGFSTQRALHTATGVYFYSADEQEQLAVAWEISGNRILEGSPAEPVLGVATFDNTPNDPKRPRLSPEGDQLFVVNTTPSSVSTLELYQRAGTTWAHRATAVMPFNINSGVSSPTRAGAAPVRRMVSERAGDLDEYIEGANNTWTVATTHLHTQFEVVAIAWPHLSADGLRLVFQAKQAFADPAQSAYYSDRSSIDAPFRAAQLIYPAPGPNIDMPALSADCSRLYASINGVIYVIE
ncbi:MAG: hypothetical protein H0T89_05020 [Deltaproteobacteria bacterium]|nr:hypothetical protein [Deltaproteobacteria bacterium]MDQ3300620.1 hypothetical protein [Myxococcota bacterium]